MKLTHSKLLSALLLIMVSVLISCSSEPVTERRVSLSGTWRAGLESHGVEIPFFIEFDGAAAYVINGEERIEFSTFTVEGAAVTMGFEHYDSYIRAQLSEDGNTMSGNWRRRAPDDGETKMSFQAERGVMHRFHPAEESLESAEISGSWKAKFAADPEDVFAEAIFEQNDSLLSGTFLTRLGDFRYIAGRFENNFLQLSCFDGAHAFLFTATLQDDGSLRGDFWSRSDFHDTWVAERGKAEMGDPYSLTSIRSIDNKFRFNFPDTEGLMTSQDEFAGSPLLVQIMGTWCPNCNDESRLLVELFEKYKDDGLKIVSLANEFSRDFGKNAEVVKKFKAHYGIGWPLLVVGSASKKAASEALSDLSEVLAYPTLVFVGRDGQVKKVHTGFVGPGTGEHYITQKEELQRDIEELLKN